MIEILLPEIKKINNKYPKIDWGGCGTFYYHLSEKLNKLNIKNQIVGVEVITVEQLEKLLQ